MPPRELAIVVPILAYFAVRLVYLALRIAPAVPPDETTHFGLARIFSAVVFLPADSPESFSLGLVSHRPPLYYLLMGKSLSLNLLPLSDLVFLRLINVGLGLIMAGYAYRWVRLITENRIVAALFTVLFTNTLMLTGLTASVNYDNLTNLLAVMSLFYLFSYLDGHDGFRWALFVACVLAGALTKLSFLPLGAVLVAVWLVRDRALLFQGPRRVLATWVRSRVGFAAATALVALLLLSNLGLYGGNLMQYGRLVPSAEQVVGLDNALENRIFARNHAVRGFRAGELTFYEATAIAERIGQPGDRAMALTLLRIAQREPRENPRRMDRVQYMFTWAGRVMETVVGYTGHRSWRKPPLESYPYWIVLGISALIAIRKWRSDDGNGHLAASAVIVAFYLGVLVCWVNYPIYLRSGHVFLSLQGRHIFPVLAPLYGLVAYYLLNYCPKRWQLALAGLVGAYAVYGDLPSFLIRASSGWFAHVSG